MRLSERIKNIICENIKKNFGDVNLFLFGSRVNDTKKGGDIDLAVEINISKEIFREKKIKFISSMIRSGFDLKIDLVQYKKNNSLLSNEIEKNSIRIL